MLSAGFEPTISAGERSQTHVLDRVATGIGDVNIYGSLMKEMELKRKHLAGYSGIKLHLFFCFDCSSSCESGFLMGEIVRWVYAIRGDSIPSIINIKEAENRVQKENGAAGRNIHLVNMRSYRQRFVARGKTSVETGLCLAKNVRTWSDNGCRRWTVQA